MCNRASRHYGYRLVGLVLWSLVSAGCASAPKQTALMERSEATGMTANELRLRLHEFALRFGLEMEQVGMSLPDTMDPALKINLRRWLIYGQPAYHKTLFQSDPYLAMWDTWVLTAQMIQYYEDGPGRDDFGPYQDSVIAVHKRFYNEFAELERRAIGSDDISDDEAAIQRWVADRSLRSYLFARESVLRYEDAAQQVAESGGGLGSALQSIEAGLADMNTRMTVLTDYIPRQVQWQLESSMLAFTSSAGGGIDLERILPITEYLSRVDTIVANNLAFAAMTMDRQRAATLQAIAEERRAILEGLAGERAAIIAALSTQQREALSTIDGLIARSLTGLTSSSDLVIDDAVKSGLVLVAAVLVAAIIYRIIAVKLITHRRA